MRAAPEVADLPPSEAFERMMQLFDEIPGAGTNLLTEVLMALDRRMFAVMNQNTVSGLSNVDPTAFPVKPSKANVTGAKYALFCERMEEVRATLGLADFAELDALLNYAYWGT